MTQAAKKRRPRVAIVSLGCSKNLIDSERLMHMLANAGYDVAHEPQHVSPHDTVVVNTCGFIGDAKEESIEEILKWSQAKTGGKIKCLYVMGCLSERYREELTAEIPEVDGWFGKTDWPGLVRRLAGTSPATASFDRIITTPRHHAYLKIAEGCNRFCAFCAIPLITGRYTSRPIDQLEQEARALVAKGVSEINVIAQDLSAYGTDLYGHHALAQLIESLARIEGVKRIRLHYAYPSDFPLELLDVMARYPNVCSYIDIALQHISDGVLKRMRRHIDSAQTRQLLHTMRSKVPGLHIRTTLMVGFPGETDADFNELLDFVREQRFERMGAFAYCEEDDTYAALHLTDDVPAEVKQQRLDRLMALQEEISAEIQQQKVGQTLEVVIDRREGHTLIGRTQWDSPEVDPEVIITIPSEAKMPQPGSYCNVKIDSATAFELFATIV